MGLLYFLLNTTAKNVRHAKLLVKYKKERQNVSESLCNARYALPVRYVSNIQQQFLVKPECYLCLMLCD
jgi:hypothetical protein